MLPNAVIRLGKKRRQSRYQALDIALWDVLQPENEMTDVGSGLAQRRIGIGQEGGPGGQVQQIVQRILQARDVSNL